MIRDYLALTKPRLTSLVLATVAFGYVLGSGDVIDKLGLFQVLLGVALVAGGGGAMNMVMEKDLDGLMMRTRNRPLPAHRLKPAPALFFGLALSAAGMGHLAYRLDLHTAGLALAAWLCYVAVYTPLKVLTFFNTWVGAVTGALPPLIGWSAATGGRLAPGAWGLFAILFVWQMPHFFALACIYRDDYTRAGFKMLGAMKNQGRLAEGQILFWSLALVPVTWIPVWTGLAGGIYAASALALGAMFLPLAVRLYYTRAPKDGQRVFLSSLAYQPLLFIILIWDRHLGAL